MVGADRKLECPKVWNANRLFANATLAAHMAPNCSVGIHTLPCRLQTGMRLITEAE